MLRQLKLMLVLLFSTLLLCSSLAWSLPRFIDLNDGTMLDTSSSLRWLKNANCFGGQYWDTAMSFADNLAAPACGLSDGSVAKHWHLPTIEELQTLVAAPDNLRYNTLNAAGFTNVQADYYWSSSTSSDSASNVHMGNGSVSGNDKEVTYYVWPVRGGQYWSLDSLIITGSADFGSVPVGSTSSGHPFTLKNSSVNPISVSSIALSGTDSGQFILATGGTNPCSSLSSLTLAGGAGCTVLVSAKPTTISNKSANLTVTAAGLSLNVPLSATGAALSVTYNGNGNSSGSVPLDSTGYTLNATVTVLDNSGGLAKSGYVFNGWNTTADGSGTSYQPGATFNIAAPTTLYAKWTAPITPPSGMVSWWRGENNGLDALGANNGILHSASSFAFATGKVGQAFSFSGATTEYVDAPSSASLNVGTNDFAIVVWIKTSLPSAAYTWKRLVTKRGTSGNWYSLVINGPVAGAVTFEIAASVSMSSNVAVNDGKWHHIAVCRDPAGTSPRLYRMYIDGVQNSTLSDTGLNLNNTGPLELGKWSTEAINGAVYSGLMDEVQIFSRSLTTTEIQSIYNAGPAGIIPPPTVTSLSPSTGPTIGGASVTITGTNLTGATAVKFGSTAATSFTVNSDTRITATAPVASAGTVDVTVTATGGISAIGGADQFTYVRVDQTIDFGSAPTIAVGGHGSISAVASSALVLTYDSQTPAVCGISGTVVSGLATGTCSITANQAGDGTYNPATQQQSFTITPPVAPTVVSGVATAITGSVATLNGTINANYSSAVASFEYGLTTSYGSAASADQSPVSGGSATAVSAAIGGLVPGTVYHFRAKGVNTATGAVVYGDDKQFAAAPPRFVDLNDGTILDTVHSLRWLKDANYWGVEVPWNAAVTLPKDLSSNQFGVSLHDGSVAGDWRLPTYDELHIFTWDGYSYDSLNAAGFTNVKFAKYWSATIDPDNHSNALYVTMMPGYEGSQLITEQSYFWPVRGGQYWSAGPLVVIGTAEFGAQTVGAVSSGHQFTLKNSSGADYAVSGIALSGAAAGEFNVLPGGPMPCDSLSPLLAAGASCTLIVTAQPKVDGSKSAVLAVNSAVGSSATPLSASATYAVPAVTGITPASGFAAGGTSVTINGTNFSGATAVKFGATDAAGFSAGSDTQVTATSPAGLVGQTVDITVTTPGGTSAVSSADQFTYTLQYQAKNQSSGSYYTTLAEAIAVASAGHEIRAYGGQFDGAVSLVRDIILNGGYNMAFSAKESLPTTLNGGLTVTGGAARMDSVTVKGTLTIQGGSLQVSGVVVQ